MLVYVFVMIAFIYGIILFSLHNVFVLSDVKRKQNWIM